MDGMIRHFFIAWCVTMVFTGPLRAGGAESRGSDERRLAVHVLNRLAFGPRPGEIEEVQRLGWEAWARKQLDPASVDDSDLHASLAHHFPSLGMSLAQAYRVYQPDYQGQQPSAEEMRMRHMMRGRIKDELKHAVLYRAVYSERQFQEVIAEFWRNHFNIDHNKGEVEYQANHYEQHVLRAHAFGRFEDMLMASAKHPAMLIYLDNVVSQKPLAEHERRMIERFERRSTYRFNPYIDQLQRQRGLNENYARELMELHTLGVDNGYTQHDVTELARVLTGWTAGWQRGRGGEMEYGFLFAHDLHDEGRKRVMGAAFRWADGVRAGEMVIRALARHPNTARFISWKLCRYLVNDHPPEALVERVAGVFQRTGGHLPSVYRAIVFSDEFADPANIGAKFKTPFEFTVSALRASGARLQHPSATLYSLEMQGQPIYGCVDPPGYYDQAEAWLDPGALLYRWEYALKLARDEAPGVRLDEALLPRLRAMRAQEKVSTLDTELLGGALDDRSRAALEAVDDDRLLLGMLLGSSAFQRQ